MLGSRNEIMDKIKEINQRNQVLQAQVSSLMEELEKKVKEITKLVDQVKREKEKSSKLRSQLKEAKANATDDK